jgi:hypothetical protein
VGSLNSLMCDVTLRRATRGSFGDEAATIRRATLSLFGAVVTSSVPSMTCPFDDQKLSITIPFARVRRPINLARIAC